MRRRDARGYTLMEVLISCGIFTLVLAAALLIYRTGLNFNGRVDAESNAKANANDAVQRMSMDVVPASAVLPVAHGTTSGPTSLALAVPVFFTSGASTGLYTGTDDQVCYAVSGRNLLVSTYAASGSSRPSATNLVVLNALPTNLTALFSYYATASGGLRAVSTPASASVVAMTLPTVSVYGNSTRSESATTYWRLRNDR